jgi:hypothetical protein
MVVDGGDSCGLLRSCSFLAWGRLDLISRTQCCDCYFEDRHSKIQQRSRASAPWSSVFEEEPLCYRLLRDRDGMEVMRWEAERKAGI